MSDAASFIASFPGIQSAIKIHGDGNGMRIQLDIPESEMAEAVLMLAWRQKALRVRIEPDSSAAEESRRIRKY